MKPAVHLVTYADRLAGDLPGLRQLLEVQLRGVFAGVHILPFFRPFDGSDAGFDPEDHTEVDQRLGSWDDVAGIGSLGEVMADLIVNHMSVNSPQFRDVSARGDASEFAGMFLTLDRVFPGGARESELVKIYRPGPKLPFTPVTLRDGTQRIHWTTFTDQQVDLNVDDPQALDYLQSILEKMAESGVTTVRLDAVGYAVKRAGTSCFMLPETFNFIDDVTDRARGLGMAVLVEVHSHYQTQVDISRHVDYIYDFALPPLLLHALFHVDIAPLAEWIRVRPLNVVSVLDTHDGIGVIDAGPDAITGAPGLLSGREVSDLVAEIHRRCRGDSLLATGAAADNIDAAQVNCTFFEALGRDEERYLLARAVQFFLPGAAQVYYVGLLAGHNDLKLLADTGTGRDINRHYYDPNELSTALASPVVQRLLELIQLRNTHAAFGGSFDWRHPDPVTLVLTWTHETASLQLHADFSQGSFTVTETPAAAA